VDDSTDHQARVLEENVRPRIVLADDHRMVAEGLRNLLEPIYELVGIVEDGRALVDAALRLEPDVIVADITMPLLNGLDAIDQLRRQGCRAKVIFLTMHKDPLYAARAMRVGATGYVLKHSASAELLTAIGEVLEGRGFVSPVIAHQLDQVPDSLPDGEVPLTRRQREVLQLFAEGHSAKEVARLLHISSRTAEGHKAQVMNLLGIRSTAELVQCAIRYGFIAPP
jgi:DNA-binding NarL/FixJ family response regulator